MTKTDALRLIRTVAVAAFVTVPALPADAVETSQIVSPVATLPVRAAPPSSFSTKGDQTGTALPGISYRVMEKQLLRSLGGLEEWVRIEPIAFGDSGWVFAGNGQQSNFMIVGR